MPRQTRPLSRSRSRQRRRVLGWVGVGAGAAAVLAAVIVVVSIVSGALQRPTYSDEYIAEANERIAEEFNSENADEAADPEPLAVAFLGDSYTFGTGRTEGSENRWSSLVSKELGWSEARFAVGGTGYVQGDNYQARVGQVIEAAPDVVIVSGGRNDWRVPGDVEAAANAVFGQLRSGLPDAAIIALNPWWDDDDAPAGLSIVDAGVRTAADAHGVPFIDVGQPLQGHPEYLSDDGVHPNDAGYQAIADAVQPRLAEIVTAS